MSKQTDEIREMLESFAQKEKKERELLKKDIVNYLNNKIKEKDTQEKKQETEFDDGFFLETQFRHMRISKQEQDLFTKELKDLMKKYKVFIVTANLIHKF